MLGREDSRQAVVEKTHIQFQQTSLRMEVFTAEGKSGMSKQITKLAN